MGGLRGLCGSLYTYLAKNGFKNLAVISRSGHEDAKSRYIIKQVEALGGHVDLLVADPAIPDPTIPLVESQVQVQPQALSSASFLSVIDLPARAPVAIY